MHAMILAAGLGTRMRPLTEHCPKPLMPLMIQPMLDHLLAQLHDQGVRQVVVNLHHHATQLAAWLGDGQRWGVQLTPAFEPDILGTAGALKQVETLLGKAPFLVMNADVLMDFDVPAVLAWHCQRQAMVTMVLRPDVAVRSYGPVVVDAQDRVVCINGRPAAAATATGRELMFTGMQIVSPAVLKYIPPARFVTTTGDVYPALLAAQEAIYAYEHTGYWMDIGVPERYLQAHWDALNGTCRLPWTTRLPAGSQYFGTPEEAKKYRRDVTLLPPVVLGPNVSLAPGVCLGPYAVLGAGCQVGAGARIQHSVLWERVVIGEQAHIHGSVLATGVQIPAASRLEHHVQSV